MLGLSYQVRVLVVSYTLREDETEIRIISARKATKKEQKAYTGEKLWGKNTIFQKWKDVKTLIRKGWRNKSPFEWVSTSLNILNWCQKILEYPIRIWSTFIWGTASNRGAKFRLSGQPKRINISIACSQKPDTVRIRKSILFLSFYQHTNMIAH